MSWQAAKTNWTRAEYFNFEDMNKIESNTEYLVSLLAVLEIVVSLTIIKTRNISYIDYAQDLNRIEENVGSIGDALFKPDGWETPITNWKYGNGPTSEDINRIEKNLEILYNFLQGNVNHIQYCGMWYSGEDII